MTPKDLFNIILKVLALMLITNALLPAISNFFNWFKADISIAFILLGISFLFLALIYFVLFKTNAIIKFLKLDKGFDTDKFSISKIPEEHVINLSCIIIGLYLTFNSLPTILLEIIQIFKHKVSNSVFESTQVDNFYLYHDIIYFFVGLILIALRKNISRLFIS